MCENSQNAQIRKQFTTFITKVIISTSINYKKKVTYINHYEYLIIDEENGQAMLEDKSADAYETININESNEYFNLANLFSREEYCKAMNTLTDRQQLVLRLTVLDKLSNKEAAKIIGTTEGSVKKSKHLAKEKFLQALKEGD